MSQNIFEITSPESMVSLGKKIAGNVDIGTVIGLYGELGSGKTTFTKGFAQGLQIEEQVTSPTFKIVSEYNCNIGILFHIDCYRLHDYKEFIAIDAERYLYPESGITLIEWADKIEPVLPQPTPSIHFQWGLNSDTHRNVKINGLIL